MKKLVVSLIIGVSLAIAPSAFALKAMTADNMKDTTGQAGIKISLSKVGIHNTESDTTYFFGSELSVGLTVHSDESFMMLDPVTALPGAVDYNGYAFTPSPLSITFGTYPLAPADVIIIGLPTLAIYKSSSAKTYSVGATQIARIEKSSGTTTIVGGTLFIWAD